MERAAVPPLERPRFYKPHRPGYGALPLLLCCASSAAGVGPAPGLHSGLLPIWCNAACCSSAADPAASASRGECRSRTTPSSCLQPGRMKRAALQRYSRPERDCGKVHQDLFSLSLQLLCKPAQQRQNPRPCTNLPLSSCRTSVAFASVRSSASKQSGSRRSDMSTRGPWYACSSASRNSACISARSRSTLLPCTWFRIGI